MLLSAAKAGLAIAPGVPRETEARLKILGVGVIDGRDAVVDTNERGGCRVENYETVVALCRRHVPVVAKSEFEHQVLTQLVVVLHERAECALRDAAGAVAERDGKGACVVGYEGRDRREDEAAVVQIEIVI